MTQSLIRLKKGEDRRIRSGHPWIFSNEIDTATTPLKSFQPGQEVIVQAHDHSLLGSAYINPHSLIAARIFSRNAEQTLDKPFLIEKLQHALLLREQIFPNPFYRLALSESDGIPGVVIDRFDQHLVVQINTAGMENKQTELAEALCYVLPKTESILMRNDSAIRDYEKLPQYVQPLYGEPPQEVELIENDVRFIAPIWKGQKTGWFYDHRMNRARLQRYAEQRTVLDVFSYLGGWGIQAACAGASHVDCIESSAFAAELIQRNAALNSVDDKVDVICNDAFDAMKALIQSGKQYDIIVLDPPAFVKRAKDLKEGSIAYLRLNELALRLLKPDGLLISCSCSMHIGMDTLTQLIQRAAVRTKHDVQLIERGHQGPDHPIHLAIPETDYLKAVFIRRV